MIALLLGSLAAAGQAPWALDPGEHNVFVGVDVGRFERVGTADGPRTLGTPVLAAQLTAVWTTGLTEQIDMELILPVRAVWAAKPDAAFCTASRPDGWCATTVGVSDLQVRGRVQLLDEERYRPLSVALHGAVSTGALYGPARSRLTTLGDGTTDLALGGSVGRTGTVGRAWYRVSAGGSYRYRFGLARVDGRKVPADEVGGEVSAMASPVPWFGLGASLSGFHRLRGESLAQVDIAGPNAWIRLAASHVRLGPQLAAYSRDGWTVFATVQMSAFARNTPSDGVGALVGVGRTVRLRD